MDATDMTANIDDLLPNRFDAGYTKPLIGPEDMPSLVKSLVQYYVLCKPRMELDQFLDGNKFIIPLQAIHIVNKVNLFLKIHERVNFRSI